MKLFTSCLKQLFLYALLTLTGVAPLFAKGTPQYVVLDGYDNRDSNAQKVAIATLNLLPDYKEGAAKLSFKNNLLENTPTLKVLIIPFQGLEWRSGTGGEEQADSIRQLISTAYAHGKHILIYGDTYLQGANAIGESMFKDNFGASASFMDIQDKYDGTTLTPFMVRGIATDELGKDISLNANTVVNGATRSVGSVRSELSTTIPFLYYDEDKGNIAGVRRQGATARAILLSFRLESIADDTQRSAFLKKLLDWLTSASTTEVSEEATQELSLSPNPATNNLLLHFTSAQSRIVRLVDMLGRIRWQQECVGEEVGIDVSSLPNGSYYAQVQSGSARRVYPLLIQR